MSKPTEEAGRANEGKPDLSLIPYCFEVELARVMMFGEKKYQRYNYLKGHRISSLIASMKRHIGKIMEGKDIDEESGVSHWAHIAAGCLMAIHQTEVGTIRDDRYRPVPDDKEMQDVIKVMQEPVPLHHEPYGPGVVYNPAFAPPFEKEETYEIVVVDNRKTIMVVETHADPLVAERRLEELRPQWPTFQIKLRVVTTREYPQAS